MTICDHPKGSCGGDIIWLNGKCYSMHFAPSHWSRLKAGTAKPKSDFAADTTDEEQASLKAAIAAVRGKGASGE